MQALRFDDLNISIICLLTSGLLICWLEWNGNLRVNQHHTDCFPITAYRIDH